MRITGGIYRGRTIACPKGEIRPAMDRMRESVFAVLGDLEGKSFLDLFSGSGVIGIEAASRGAEPVVLVEKDYIKKDVLRENISFVKSEIRFFIQPVERFIKKAEPFDIIFLDPPFPMKNKLNLLQAIEERGILKPGGLLLMHYPKEESFPDSIGCLARVDVRSYGRSVVIFYARPA